MAMEPSSGPGFSSFSGIGVSGGDSLKPGLLLNLGIGNSHKILDEVYADHGRAVVCLPIL